MAKWLRITVCRECGHHLELLSGNYCRHPTVVEGINLAWCKTMRRLDDGPIPIWCPLEDAPEESETEEKSE